MKELLNKANERLKQLGYKKKGNSFWKIEDGFYKLINFQKGAYGNYFFVNICIHPIGLPELLTNQLVLKDNPKEYECILRQRIEEIVDNEQVTAFKRTLVSMDDEETIQAILNSFSNDVERWFRKWGSYETLANVSEYELSGMLTVAPRLKRKAYLMLKFYCLIKTGDINKSIDMFKQYINENIEATSFLQVDNYLKKLIEI